MPDKATIIAGKLNRRIQIQMPVDAQDGQKGVIRTWVPLPGCKSVPAAMDYSNVPRKGDETFSSHQVYPSAFVTFTIRYRASVNISNVHRVLYGSRVFNIRSTIVPLEKQSMIKLQCEELQAAGSLH